MFVSFCFWFWYCSSCLLIVTTCRRLSLPTSRLEPIPNIKHWQYLHRPDVFAALSPSFVPHVYVLIEGLLRGRINDSPHPSERMLAVVRFILEKDLKFVVYRSSPVSQYFSHTRQSTSTYLISSVFTSNQLATIGPPAQRVFDTILGFSNWRLAVSRSWG